LIFVGPSPDAIRQMGDKTEARRLMAAAGVPVVPGSHETVADAGEAEHITREIGYPVILNAVAGGGGIGMTRVDNHEDRGPAVAGARAVGYVNAGTVEFLVDAAGGFYFLEMNTRLQVEHPVTEEVTELDLVVAQLRVAQGERLPWRQEEIAQRRAAIECRVYAEDPAKGFLPSPGKVERLELPSGEGIRIESGVEAGRVVPAHYDPRLFKLITPGTSRAEAVERMAAG